MNNVLFATIIVIAIAQLITLYIQWGPEKALVVPDTVMTIQEFEKRVKEG